MCTNPLSSFNYRTRYALNIKGLPYKTEWLCFSEIAPKMKELGLKQHPSSIGATGIASIGYTVPTIVDPDNGQVINESFAIAVVSGSHQHRFTAGVENH